MTQVLHPKMFGSIRWNDSHAALGGVQSRHAQVAELRATARQSPAGLLCTSESGPCGVRNRSPESCRYEGRGVFPFTRTQESGSGGRRVSGGDC